MSEPAEWLHVSRGEAPLLLSLPHTGTQIPDDIAGQLRSTTLALVDTDCWVEKLYDFAPAMGVTVVRTTLSRTVIDVNRDPSGASLYPGQATTGLCPVTTFDGEPLYAQAEPDAAEIDRRRRLYFDPYHHALRTEISRLRARHGRVILYDAHSIRSRVPRLFEGRLPDFNIGTYDGRSCGSDLTRLIETVCDSTSFTRVTNGRFKGGWITRHYGRPQTGVHAVQMELAQASYMEESCARPFPPYDPARAAPMRRVLKELFERLLKWAEQEPRS